MDGVIKDMSGVRGSEFKEEWERLIGPLFPTALPVDVGQSFHQLEPGRVCQRQ